jgi:hypothetical protein
MPAEPTEVPAAETPAPEGTPGVTPPPAPVA